MRRGAAILAGVVLAGSVALAQAIPYEDLPGWHVERVAPANNSLGGCFARAAFKNGENLTFLQFADQQWALGLGPFKTLQEGIDYRVQMQIVSRYGTQPRTATFSLQDHSLFGNVSKDLVNELAAAPDIPILLRYVVIGTRARGSMQFVNSAGAIRSVVHCREELVAANQSVDPSVPTSPPPSSNDSSSGTGFFVAPHTIVTNYHVIESCNAIFVRYPEYRPERAYLRSKDATNDLALLSTDMDNVDTAKFGLGPRVGQQVATYGFPLSGLLSSSGNFTLGNISSLTGLGDDTRQLQTSVPIQPGNSGGPLLNMSGAVIGMIHSRLRLADALPQGVNFAIQAAIVMNFLGANDVKPSISNTSEALDPARIAELAREFTIQVLCDNESPTSKTAQATLSEPSLLQSISAGSWAIGDTVNCSAPEKRYSLAFASGNIVWRSGIGDTDVETVNFSSATDAQTTTLRSDHRAGRGESPGTTWNYTKIGPDRVRITRGGGRPSILVRCR
jgi:serine protease Do